ncbi:MAG: extensin family protein [Polyangiales bacterium]
MVRRTPAVAALVLLVSAVGVGGCLQGPRHRARATAKPTTTSASPSGPATDAWGNVALTPTPAGADPSSSSAPETTATAAPTDAADLGAGPDKTISTADGDLVYSSGSTPAITYGAMDGATCEKALKARKIPYVRVTNPTQGVADPMRITGKIHGVDFHGLGLGPKATSLYEIVDCRLLLALDDFAAVLEKHDVVEAIHMSIYRAAKTKPKPGQKPKSQHEAALAMDLGTLVKKDGTKLVVLDDWHGFIGQPTCGPKTGPTKVTKQSTELRAIMCEQFDKKLFNVNLTPNYNKPHVNHFHLEVTRGVKWFILH